MKRIFTKMLWCFLISVIMTGMFSFSSTAMKAENQLTPNLYMTYINPLYEDVVTEAELNDALDIPVFCTNTGEYYTTVEEAGVYLRECMKQRQQVIYIGYETNNLLSGVVCEVNKNILEMAATDGNRLTRIIEKITNEKASELSCVIPSKTLQEFLRIASLVSDDKVCLIIEKTRIIFKTSSMIMVSRLLEGEYPPYKQLIPQNCEKNAVLKRDEMISALERVAVMVNERTNIVKFIFGENTLFLKADTPGAGLGEDSISSEYTDEELTIAFNYKYVLDSLKIMQSENVKIGLGGSLSATLFRPDSEDDYLCLIMPIQIR